MRKLNCYRLFCWTLLLSVLSGTTAICAETDQDHKVAPLEKLRIDVVGEKDLSTEYTVTANGKISFPYLGEVTVTNKTTFEIETDLKQKLGADWYVDPQVIVSVKEYRVRMVNVIGEVMQPKSYPLPGEQKMTILDALSQAGGPTRGANTKRIEFIRQGNVETFRLEDLKKMKKEKLKTLEPGDTIFVPQSAW